MNTTVTLRDGTSIRTSDTEEVNSLLNHMSMGGQDAVSFLIADNATGACVWVRVGDVARIEVVR